MTSAKGAFELFMGDVGRYLEDSLAGKEADVVRLWHAVLYLQRAVQALADRDSQESTLEVLRKRIDKAIEIVSNVHERVADNWIKAALEEALSFLKEGRSS